MKNVLQQQNDYEKSLESFLPTSVEEVLKAIRWLSKQPLLLQKLAKEKAQKLYFAYKEKYKDLDSYSIALLADLLTAYKLKRHYDRKRRKNPNFKKEHTVLITHLEASTFSNKKRVSPKRLYLQMHKQQLLQWRTLGASYADISSRILTINGETISAEYIRQFMLDKKEI